MKITVLCNRAGDIESVAFLNPAPAGQFHIEIEGGTSQELEIADHELDRGALRGDKGHDVQRQHLDALRRHLRAR